MKKSIYLRAYLNDNLGDDLFVQILCNKLNMMKFIVDYEGGTAAQYPPNLRKMYNFIDKCIFYFLRRIIRNRNLYEKYKNYIRKKYLKKTVAAVYVIGSGYIEDISYIDSVDFYNKKPFIVSCNFGPYKTEKYRKRIENLFSKAYDVCFRDYASYNLFSNLDNVRYEKDLVFSYPINLCNSDNNSVFISVINFKKDSLSANYSDEYMKFISDCIEHYSRKGKKIYLVGFCSKEGDRAVVETLYDKYKMYNVIPMNYPENSIDEIVECINNSSEVIATRYHAMVLGMLCKKKVYVIAYSNKTVNVIKDIDENIKYVLPNMLKDIEVDDFIDNFGYVISDDKRQEIIASSNRQLNALITYLEKKCVISSNR